MRGLDLAHLKLPQPGRDTRHKSPIVVHGLGLELLFGVLGEPALYQVVHLHGCIQRNAAAHFLFKGICLPLQFLFQLFSGQAWRGSEGAVYQHLTTLPVVAVGDPDAVGAGAVLLCALYDFCHRFTLSLWGRFHRGHLGRDHPRRGIYPHRFLLFVDISESEQVLVPAQ